jgi:SAM-dependent methyltransferase
MARVLRELPASPARVLDLGVGTGRELAALLDAGHAPTGLDASRAMLARCARRSRPVPLVCADFWNAPLPFPDGAFDAVIALHGTLAHPPEAAAVHRLARDVARLVVPGGLFVAEVPSLAWLDSLSSSAPVDAGDRVARRTGLRTARIEDLVVGASVEALVLDEAQWRDGLSPGWTTRIEPIEEPAVEWLIVARRDCSSPSAR